MNKIVLVFLFFGSFVFGQDKYVDKKLGLSNKLDPFELRIYISQDAHIERKVFVFKKLNENDWEAKLFTIYFDDVKVENIKSNKRGQTIWTYILNTKINKVASYDDIKYKEEEDIPIEKLFHVPGCQVELFKMSIHSVSYKVSIKDGSNESRTIYMGSPKSQFYEFPDIDEYQYYFKFVWLIENEFNIKLDVK